MVDEGNLFIGQSCPTHKIAVKGRCGSEYLQITCNQQKTVNGRWILFKGNKDNRVFALIVMIFSAAGSDFFIFKIYRSILIAFFKESTKHIHVQSFSETARSCKQRYHWLFVDKVLNHHGFIDIVIF